LRNSVLILKKVQILKELYSNPDEVDLTVGQYLDEDFFPGTSVPRSQIITSLFSLFKTGIGDRFSPGYSVLKCLIVETPWDCHPANALEELLWQPAPSLKTEHGRWLSKFWIEELNLHDNGFSSVWRLIHDNSNVKCLQKNPMFPAGYTLPTGVINDIACKLSDFTTPPIKKNPWPTVFAIVALTLIVLNFYFCFRKKRVYIAEIEEAYNDHRPRKSNSKLRIEKALSIERSVRAFEQKLRVTIEEEEYSPRHLEGSNKKIRKRHSEKLAKLRQST